MYYHKAELSSMTAAWLLPIVATVVCASSGGIVAGVLPNNQYALWTVIVSYILWGTGVPLATCVMVIYFQRLTVYHLPPREVIVSVFLPLGPLGQGGFGVMQLGKVAMEIFPLTGTLSSSTTNSGEILYVVGWLTATIMWGFGLVWLFFALATISRSRFPFNMVGGDSLSLSECSQRQRPRWARNYLPASSMSLERYVFSRCVALLSCLGLLRFILFAPSSRNSY